MTVTRPRSRTWIAIPTPDVVTSPRSLMRDSERSEVPLTALWAGLMPRRMSCSMTVVAVLDRTKTVTRRHVDTWRDLKPGDRLVLIEKGMGLPKGARQVVLAEVEIVDVRVEPIVEVLGEFLATRRAGRTVIEMEERRRA